MIWLKHIFYDLQNGIEDILKILNRLVGKFIPDKQYLKIVYRLKMGKKLNLNNPRTFNEKLQWLKLYNRCVFWFTII